MRSLIAHGWVRTIPASPPDCANLNLMHRFAPVALATLLAATVPALLCAQTPTPFTVPSAAGHFTDPANLAGERVRPRDGRELPIDGGIGLDGQPDNALGLAQMLRKLSTRASLMLIVAHPDDEDGGMLAYYSRGLGVRVGVLTLTRGEGGQNQMTGDFEDALGLIRTQELLAADRYMGVDTQMFGTEVDFGFSKTKAEAFQKWNHERVLYDAVRAVRIFRPLVIAAVFSGAVTDGHGQHQVSGEIAQEVFKAAGDPNVFPELTREGILPWQPLKVFARVPFSRVTAQGLYDYATGQTVPAEFTNYVTGQKFTTEPTADVTIHEGDNDPLLTTCAANPGDLPASLRPTPGTTPNCEPLSYVQFARIGLGLQRTQIGRSDRVPRPGRVDVGYHLYGSRVCAQGLPDPTPDLCISQSTPQMPVILSEGSHPRAAAEEPRGSTRDESSSTLFNPELSHTPSFFDGIDTSWAGIGSLDPNDLDPVKMVEIERHAQNATAAYPAHPELIAPELATTLKWLDQQIASITARPNPTLARANLLHELRIKRVQLNDALAFAVGVSLNAKVADPSHPVVEGSPFKATATLESPTLTSGNPHFLFNNQAPEEKREASSLGWRAEATTTIPAPIFPTVPYFNRPNIEQPFYDLTSPELRLAPQTPPPFIVTATVDYRGTTLRLAHTVNGPPTSSDLAIPSAGTAASQVDQPVQVVGPGSIFLSSHAQVLPDSVGAFEVTVTGRPQALIKEDTAWNGLPQSWKLSSAKPSLEMGTERFTIHAPKDGQRSISLHASFTRANGSLDIEGGFRSAGYGNLPRTNYYVPATLRIVPVDLRLPPADKRRIAYLPGTGDAVPAALASIGLTPTMITVADLTPDKLKAFDTVILGVRTYNAHPDLHGAPTQALLDFARNGGNVVVQYQTPEFTAADAPYPISVARGDRVVDETDPVKLLDPGSPLLSTPNRITSADFDNWIEERGHGFPDSWDPHYTALTETHDPGAPAEHILPQDPQRGGILTVQLGRGRWTYCAFALYRQLPEAVPGAFRLFVNLLNP